MKLLYMYLFLIIIFFCTCSNSQNHNNNDSIKTVSNIDNDTVIRLNYNKCELCWDMHKQCFINDEKFQLFVNNSIDKYTLITVINNITDTTDLKKKICSKKNNLVKGDLAFILLYKTGYISPAYDFKMQFDIFHNDNCEFPFELLNYVENNRCLVKSLLLRKYSEDKSYNDNINY